MTSGFYAASTDSSYKALKGTIINRTNQSTDGESLEITSAVPLSPKWLVL